MKNADYKRQILIENFNALENKETLMRDYIETSAANDPNFFRWLFGEEFENDFDSGLSKEQQNEYKNFVDSFQRDALQN